MRDNIIGRELRRLRERRGWTQQALSERVAIAQTRISEYETGARMPSARTLISLSRHLGPIRIDAYEPVLAEFFGGDDDAR